MKKHIINCRIHHFHVRICIGKAETTDTHAERHKICAISKVDENEKEANVSKLIEVLIPIQTHIKWVVLVNGKSPVKYGWIHALVQRTDFVAFSYLAAPKKKFT